MVALNGALPNGSPINGWSTTAPSIDHSADRVAGPEVASGNLDGGSARPAPGDAETSRDDALAVARLQREIASAKQRIDEANGRAFERESEVRSLLRAELMISRETLTEMERQYRERIAEVRAGAQLEVERILADARRRAVDLQIDSTGRPRAEVDAAEVGVREMEGG